MSYKDATLACLTNRHERKRAAWLKQYKDDKAQYPAEYDVTAQ